MPDYQSDLSHSLSTWSLGGGILFKATENIGVNLGAMRTFYRPDEALVLLAKPMHAKPLFLL